MQKKPAIEVDLQSQLDPELGVRLFFQDRDTQVLNADTARYLRDELLKYYPLHPDDKTFPCKDWEAARNLYKMTHPQRGDYWWEDHMIPVLIVVATHYSQVVVATKTLETMVGWQWDFSRLEIWPLSKFVERLEHAHYGGDQINSLSKDN